MNHIGDIKLRIGVLSDTHATSLAEFPNKLLANLAKVDMIIHTGDFTTRSVLEGLRELAEVRAVHGNMDSDELRQFLPDKDLFIVSGRRVGITHGWGSPYGIEDRVGSLFGDADIIVFGHSHQPRNEVTNGILFFNPGTARNSFGILTVGQQIKGEIIRL
jgi:putative phosphoesterase